MAAALRTGHPPFPLWSPAQVLPALDVWESFGRQLGQRFRDLRRHFIFEYYPWYQTDPVQHWDEAGRRPPVDLASNYMPLLGAYDSRSRRIIEQHARWMADAGIGAINLSWWGPDSPIDRLVPLLMDIMRDHDIHVTFHLEPYTADRNRRYAVDVAYLLKNYGERRRWDAFLLLERTDGKVGPVFKSFRTILPARIIDCHEVVHPVPDYTPDGEWRRSTDFLRGELRTDFDGVTLLADSLDVARTQASGFDGIAIYDNFVAPGTWPVHAAECSRRDLLFSFNVNPGFDGIVLREVEPNSCYRPPAFEPDAGPLDWSASRDRELARWVSAARILESAHTTLTLQLQTDLANSRKGFFVTYINSFNEWHEGHQFEPMKDASDLTAEERRCSYHNPEEGTYRLQVLRDLLGRVISATG